MEPKKIKQILGPTIFLRAQNYYMKGAVSFVDINPDNPSELIALVKGSGYNKYEVDIDLSRNYFFCDCPYPDICKHIGAVLLYLHHNNLSFPPEDRAIKKEKLAESITKTPERIFDLTVYENKMKKVASLFEPLQKTASVKGGYRLILLVNDDNFYNRPEITAKAQYIKKDGTPGRIDKFTPGKITEWDDDLQMVIARQLTSFEKTSAPLDIFIETILSYSHLFSVVIDGTLQPLKIHPLENFYFFAELQGFNDKEPIFQIMIILADPDNSDMVTSISPHYLHERGLFYFGMTEKGTLVYQRDNPALSRLLSGLRNIQEFSMKDIQELKVWCSEKTNPPVEVRIPHDEIRLTPVVPEVIMEVEKHYAFLEIVILFKYGEVEVLPEEKERLIHLKEDHRKKRLTLTTTQPAYEVTVLQDIYAIIREKNKTLSRGEIPASLNLHDYDFLRFITEFGTSFLERNYEVRLKGTGLKLNSRPGKITTRMTSSIDWFEGAIEYRYDDEDSSVPLEFDFYLALKGIIKSGDSYHILTESEIEKLLRLYKEGITEKGAFKIHKGNLSLIDELYESSIGEGLDEMGKKAELYRKLLNIKKIPRYTLPKKFNTKLRTYQSEGYRWLLFMEEHALQGCLADDMGLGKTVQTLALLQKLKEEGRLETSLIVVPVSTIPNWLYEIERFTTGIKTLEHMGPGRARESEGLLRGDIVITSYRTLARDIALFKEIDFHYLILDEAQNIKNSTSQTFKAVKSIASRNRLSLTGTPVENNTGELWSQIDFLNPGLLGSRKDFQKRYARRIEKEANSVTAEELKKKTSSFILRRKKEDVAADLPEKEEIIYYTEMSPKQEKFYESIRKEYKKEVEKTLDEQGINKSAIKIFEALLRLRQAALLPGLIDRKFETIDSCKLDTLKEMTAEIIEEDHKILIFSQFVTVLDAIRQHFDSTDTPYAYIDGSTKKRAGEIKKFQEDEKIKIFLLSLKAGGVGINLTAADYVIIFDPWWNPAVEAQAIDRSHRIGQTRKVIAYKYIVKNTIEEKILQLQEKKKKLVDNIISDEPTLITSMTREEIMDLFD